MVEYCTTNTYTLAFMQTVALVDMYTIQLVYQRLAWFFLLYENNVTEA